MYTSLYTSLYTSCAPPCTRHVHLMYTSLYTSCTSTWARVFWKGQTEASRSSLAYRGLTAWNLTIHLTIQQGRVGIASGYSHEPSAVSNQLHHTKATDGSSVPEHMLGHASCINYVVPAASSDLADSASSRAGDKDPTRYSRNEEGAHRDSAASRDERGAHAGLQGSPAMDRDESRGRDDEDDANDMQRVAEDVDDFLALLAS
jgi:hypothetical protein